jgi:hypothetical protein
LENFVKASTRAEIKATNAVASRLDNDVKAVGAEVD